MMDSLASLIVSVAYKQNTELRLVVAMVQQTILEQVQKSELNSRLYS